MSLEPEDLDKHLDGYGWASHWEHYESPQAKAAILLKELKLDCAVTRGGKGGEDRLYRVGRSPWKLREVANASAKAKFPRKQRRETKLNTYSIVASSPNRSCCATGKIVTG
jgi:hypothetical protein